MHLSSTIFLILMASFTNCSPSSTLIRAEEHLSSRNQQSNQLQEQSSRLTGHYQQNFHDPPQQKVKYSTFQDNHRIELRRTENFNNHTSESRTFGLRRRIKMAIPIIMYALGIATSMLGLLTLLSAKSLLVGIIILIIQLTSGAAKLALLKKEHHPHQEGWEEQQHPHKPPQNIHVHVHGSGHGGHAVHGGHGYYKPSYYSRPWDKSDSISNRIDEDYYQRLKELKELKELRESLYQQVI